MKKLISQFIRFGGVGMVCFLLETGLLWAFKNLLTAAGMGDEGSAVLAKVVAYSIATVVNYLLSVRFVFEVDPSRGRGRNFIAFLILSTIGLGINALIMQAGNMIGLVDYYMLTHIVATAIVVVYNFITRKLVLEKRDKRKK